MNERQMRKAYGASGYVPEGRGMTKERRAEIDTVLTAMCRTRWPEQQDGDYIGLLAQIVAELVDEVARLEKALRSIA